MPCRDKVLDNVEYTNRRAALILSEDREMRSELADTSRNRRRPFGSTPAPRLRVLGLAPISKNVIAL